MILTESKEPTAGTEGYFEAFLGFEGASGGRCGRS